MTRKPTARELRVAKAIQDFVTRHDADGNERTPATAWRDLDLRQQSNLIRLARIAIRAAK